MALQSTTAARRQLGRMLRDIRTTAGMTRDDVAFAHVMSRAKLESIENGRKSAKAGDVTELCRLYGADAAVTETLRELALVTGQAAWWQEYEEEITGSHNITQGFGTFLGLEEAASDRWSYECQIVDGLLQTEAYARAVECATAPAGTPVHVRESYVAVRMERQRKLFERAKPLRARFVLDEAALRRRVGDADVMQDQLEHLRKITKRPNVDIRLLPFAAGAHEATLGPFQIFGYEDPQDPAIVTTQWYGWARYNDRLKNVAAVRAVFEAIRARSIPIEEFAL